MKRISIYIIALVSTMAMGCVENEECCVNVISNSFEVQLVDADGINLLSSEAPTPINLDRTRLFLYTDGEVELVDFSGSGNLNNRYGVEPTSIDNKQAARFSFIYEGKETETIAIIQWSENKSDTLNLSFNGPGPENFLTKISQGEEVLWDQESDPTDLISIIIQD